MSTAPSTVGAVVDSAVGHAGKRTLGVLARLESLRLARHPMFLAATGLGIFVLVMALNAQADQATAEALGVPTVAFTLGIGAMIATYHQTRSFHRADELVESAPTTTTMRTAALCLAALVPALVASGWLFFKYGVKPAALNPPEWMYGPFSHLDIAWVLAANSVVAAMGGALLGIAAGRWWRFRGAAVVLVVSVALWTIGNGAALSTGGAMPAWQRWTRLFAPVTFFSTSSQDSEYVDSFNGSPGWHLVWLVTLCVLAAIAALLWRAEGRTRRRLVRIGAIALAISAVVYVLAATGGISQTVRSYPDGHSVVVRLTP